MKKNINYILAVLMLWVSLVYMGWDKIFEEPGIVYLFTYLGFFFGAYKEMFGTSCFYLQRYGSRMNALWEYERKIFLTTVIYVSCVHLVCIAVYMTNPALVLNEYAALQFYVLTLININIMGFITHMFALVYGKISAICFYLIVVFAGMTIGLLYSLVIYIYELIFLTSAFGNSLTDMGMWTQRAVNIAASYVVLAVFAAWLLKKYKKADLKI